MWDRARLTASSCLFQRNVAQGGFGVRLPHPVSRSASIPHEPLHPSRSSLRHCQRFCLMAFSSLVLCACL